MKLFYFSLLLSLLGLLTGCGNTPTKEPTSASSAATTNAKVKVAAKQSTVAGYSKRAGFSAVWENFAVKAVNEQFIRASIFSAPASMVLKVKPGKNKLLIEANFNRGFFGSGPFTALIPLVADIEPATAYRINGKIETDGVTAWIEAIDSKKIVSPKVKKAFTVSPQTTYIPLYL